MSEFRTIAFGKWILAGEHAVLRGSRALAFPLLARCLTLRHRLSVGGLEVRTEGLHGEDLRSSLLRVLERAVELLSLGQSALRGTLSVMNRVPCGAGLGASAALCVVVARWFERLGFLSCHSVYEFARQLEDLFHGESSGLDIAVALDAGPVVFASDTGPMHFEAAWIPHLYLSDSGTRASTKACVGKVKKLLIEQPDEGAMIDNDMRAAVRQCFEALRSRHEFKLRDLAKGMNLAANCFFRWGLVDRGLGDHLEMLTRAGASATKPTGAGGGGFVLSLWNEPPPTAMREGLIPCFESVGPSGLR